MAFSTEAIVEFFGKSDFFEIFNVEKNSNDIQIKQAYRKLALQHHPDKGGDAEKFKALCYIYSILSNEESRKLYLETGVASDIDDEEFSATFEEWYSYFRNLFPKLTTSAIDAFAAKYKGSDEEEEDIIKAYKAKNGNFKHIMNEVMLLEAGEERRVCLILDNAIEMQKIEATPAYLKYRNKLDGDTAATASSNQSNTRKRARK